MSLNKNQVENTITSLIDNLGTELHKKNIKIMSMIEEYKTMTMRQSQNVTENDCKLLENEILKEIKSINKKEERMCQATFFNILSNIY